MVQISVFSQNVDKSGAKAGVTEVTKIGQITALTMVELKNVLGITNRGITVGVIIILGKDKCLMLATALLGAT